MTSGQLENLTVAFIGSGAMGGAIIHALVTKNEVEPEQIVASDPVLERREELRARYGVRVTTDNGPLTTLIYDLCTYLRFALCRTVAARSGM